VLKKLGFITVSLLIISLVFALVGIFFWRSLSQAPGKDETVHRFLIVKGSSAEKIAKDLEDEKLIKSAFVFKFYTQVMGVSGKIPPGEFRIPGNLSLKGVVNLLLKGPVEVWVTIPEGLRREEISERFINSLSLEGIAADEFRANFLMLTQGFEGYLYPDTYLFPLDITPNKVVEKMRATFDLKFTDEMRKALQARGVTLEKAVIMASLLERETLTDAERPVVAGILYNRLENEWPLQVDATVQYAVANVACGTRIVGCDWWPKGLTKGDLEIDSPFNTYRKTGLPLAPIANPGIASLSAVTYPEDVAYMYYIHDAEGLIHYAETLSEHNQNISKYLQK
jgi:UPF0755 protein